MGKKRYEPPGDFLCAWGAHPKGARSECLLAFTPEWCNALKVMASPGPIINGSLRRPLGTRRLATHMQKSVKLRRSTVAAALRWNLE